MAIPATSLAAVTVDNANPGVGASESLGAVFSKHGGSFTVEDITGSGSFRLFIEGSLDGTNWFEIAHADIGSNGQFHVSPTSEIVALYIRARAIVSSGTGSATVTGLVASAA